jgi:predicted porin
MQKKLIAIAIAAALAPAAAMADTSNVTIYGKMHLSYDRVDLDATTNDTGTFLSNNSSRLGFKGSEDMGDGLKTVWQLEMGIQADGEGGVPLNSIRDTFVGISGNFGTVTAGRQAWDNLWVHDANMFSDQIGAPSVWWDNSGRANNTIKYATPNMNGFDASVTYVTPGGFSVTQGAGATPILSTATTGEGVNDTLESSYALKASYKNGPMFASLTHLSKGTVDSADKWKTTSIAGSYDFGPGKVVAQYVDQSDYNNTNGLDVKGWTIGGNYKVTGNSVIKAQYTKNDDSELNGVANNDGASMITLGYDYSLSKRTMAYVAYSRVSNDTAGTYNVTGSGHGTRTAAVGADKDPTAFSLGLVHDF